jgi:nucleotide-binding universal stress UspA family protein
MTAPIVVGYTATDAGKDAVALGARLASATDATLDIVLVLPSDERSVITPPAAGYDAHVRQRADEWLAEASAAVPASVSHRTHVITADSFAEGLVEAALELAASHIVVGAANGGIRGRHRLGSVATELLHSSAVPVVLAPEGSRRVEPSTGVSRITAAVGTRPGADVLLDEAVALAAATGAELRLVSLVTVDLPRGVDTGVIRLTGAAHAQDVLAKATAALPESIDAEVVLADGESIEDAVASLGWEPGELAVVGSSRLAQPRRLFLGSTAAKMLHELPVPMIVVPRTRTQEGQQR